MTGTAALFDLSGRLAIVAGGGKGIGRELAIGLAEAGANIVVASRTQADVDAVAAEVRARGRKSLAHELDVTDAESSAALVRPRSLSSDRSTCW